MTPEQREQLRIFNPELYNIYTRQMAGDTPYDSSAQREGSRVDTGQGSYYHVDADGKIDRSKEHFVSAKDIPFDRPGWVTSFYGWNENPEQIFNKIQGWTTEQNPNEKNRENFNRDLRAYASKSEEASMREQQQLLNTFLDTGNIPEKLRSGFAIDALDYAFREMGRGQQRKSPGFLESFVNSFDPVRAFIYGADQEAAKAGLDAIRPKGDDKYSDEYWELDGQQIVLPEQGVDVARNQTSEEAIAERTDAFNQEQANTTNRNFITDAYSTDYEDPADRENIGQGGTAASTVPQSGDTEDARKKWELILDIYQDYGTALNVYRQFYPQHAGYTPSGTGQGGAGADGVGGGTGGSGTRQSGNNVDQQIDGQRKRPLPPQKYMGSFINPYAGEGRDAPFVPMTNLSQFDNVGLPIKFNPAEIDVSEFVNKATPLGLGALTPYDPNPVGTEGQGKRSGRITANTLTQPLQKQRPPFSSMRKNVSRLDEYLNKEPPEFIAGRKPGGSRYNINYNFSPYAPKQFLGGRGELRPPSVVSGRGSPRLSLRQRELNRFIRDIR
jgi:hypothetical protein